MILYSRRMRMRELANDISEKLSIVLNGTLEDTKHEQRRLLTLTRKLRDEVAFVYKKGTPHEEIS